MNNFNRSLLLAAIMSAVSAPSFANDDAINSNRVAINSNTAQIATVENYAVNNTVHSANNQRSIEHNVQRINYNVDSINTLQSDSTSNSNLAIHANEYANSALNSAVNTRAIVTKAVQYQDSLNSQFDSRITSNTSRINSLEDDVDSMKGGFAQLTAMSNLTDDDISAAIGYSNGKQALAIGGTAHYSNNVNFKLSGATDFDSVSIGAGIGYNWK